MSDTSPDTERNLLGAKAVEAANYLEDPEEEVISSPASIPMYIAAFIITGCGLFAASLFLEDPGFSRLIFGLTALGFLVSYISRIQNISPRHVEVPALILCAGVFVMAFVGDQPFLAPGTVGEDRAKQLAVLLTWLTVFRSFTLINDGALMFCCVPTIAMIGLISTNTTEATLLTAFLVFLSAASFLMIHENFLRTRVVRADETDFSSPIPRHKQPLLFGTQFQIAAVCVIGAIIAANIIVQPLQSLGATLQLSGSLTPLAHNKNTGSSGSSVNMLERRDVQIGIGAVSTSEVVVMKVQADYPGYWRGTSFDRYVGHGWQNTLSLESTLFPDESDNQQVGGGTTDFATNPYTYSPRETLLSQGGKSDKIVHQKITLQNGIFSQLYGASEISKIKINQRSLTTDLVGTLTLPTSVANYTYEVDSRVPNEDPDVLRKASTEYPADIKRYYLQLPDDPILKAKYQKTVDEVTAGKETAYDKVDALNQWVGQNAKYNLKAGAVPSNEDAVAYFLYQQREGYCDLFAASLAMLCRTAGIPARVASGFLTGDQNEETHEFIVRQRNKHQWTEVFFPNVGWVKFDSTSFAEDISDRPTNNSNMNNTLLGILFGHGWLPPLALCAFILMLGYVLKVEVWDKRRRSVALSSNSLGIPATNMAIVQAYETATSLLGRRGLKRRPSETPTEFFQRAQARLAVSPSLHEPQAAQLVCDELEQLTLLVVRFRYSRDMATAEEAQGAQIALHSLRTALKSVPKAQLLEEAHAARPDAKHGSAPAPSISGARA